MLTKMERPLHIVKRWAPYVALGVLAMAGSFQLAKLTTVQLAARAETNPVPFVLVTESYNFDASPQREFLGQETRARRSDGARVHISTALGKPGIEAGVMAREVGYMDGRIVTLIDSMAVKTTWPHMARRMAELRERALHPPANCVDAVHTLVGYDVVAGRRVSIVKHVYPDGVESTNWLDLNLGCEQLTYRLESRLLDGSLKLRAEGRVISLKLGEPPAALFDDGPGYREVSPSLRVHMLADKLGVPWNDGMQRLSEREDADYSRR